MKYTLIVNHKQALELGIRNINQAIILGLIADSHSWAETEIIDNEVYYWTARQKIAEELEILNLKPDSVYRHLKSLEKLGIIDYIKSGKKDCVKLTKKGKSYYVGNKSEKYENSEINPKKLGNKSEKNSEINPTYKNTNTIRATKDKLPDWLNNDSWNEWVAFRKEIKKSLTKSMIKKQIEFLSNYKDSHIEIINTSIQNGWTGLFKPKGINESHKNTENEKWGGWK